MTDDTTLEGHPSKTEMVKKIIEASAAKSAVEYECERNELAEKLGLRVSVFDALVEEERAKASGTVALKFGDIAPAVEPVNGAELACELHETILRYCVLLPESATLIAFWILHAWCHEAATISPVLGITSPEKRCGKTTLMSLLSVLVPRPLHTANLSPAAMFRVIQKWRPTLLIDEGDTFLNKDKNGELLGMLNGGHNRLSSGVLRCTGDNFEPIVFDVWGPKGIAMIGRLPDTLEDRAIPVRLRRKLKTETVCRFRADRIDQFRPLQSRCARWAADHLPTLRGADPDDIPEALNDRAQDNARCLCAIADVIGGDWPEKLRSALIKAYAARDRNEAQSDGIKLLEDIAEVFTRKPELRIGSQELVDALCALEKAPWSEWRGDKPISGKGIVKLLKPYEIAPQQDNSGSYYLRRDFEDAFGRYLSKP